MPFKRNWEVFFNEHTKYHPCASSVQHQINWPEREFNISRYSFGKCLQITSPYHSVWKVFPVEMPETPPMKYWRRNKKWSSTRKRWCAMSSIARRRNSIYAGCMNSSGHCKQSMGFLKCYTQSGFVSVAHSRKNKLLGYISHHRERMEKKQQMSFS